MTGLRGHQNPSRIIVMGVCCLSWGSAFVQLPPRSIDHNRLLRAKQRYVEELSKFELFNRLKSETRQVHDDIVIRSSKDGRKYSIPQAERYRSKDWVGILLATPTSTVLYRIWNPLVFQVCWASVVATVKWKWGYPTKAAVVVHSLLGSALGLLLVFRTNAAYQRFWEGRTIWEELHGTARSLARMCMLYRKEIGREKVKRASNLICAFPFVLAEHLGAEIDDNFSHLLTREDLLLLNRVGNRPLGVLNALSMEVRSIPDKSEPSNILFSSRERLTMLAHVEKMTKAIGACERLVQTPVPLNYARHTTRFLSVWCLTLPFALVGEAGFMIVPIMTFTVWVLFGIQEIGLMIEEPFRRSLNLDVITRTMYADVQETTYIPEWAKRSKLDKSEIEDAKKKAEERLAAVLAPKVADDEKPPSEVPPTSAEQLAASPLVGLLKTTSDGASELFNDKIARPVQGLVSMGNGWLCSLNLKPPYGTEPASKA